MLTKYGRKEWMLGGIVSAIFSITLLLVGAGLHLRLLLVPALLSILLYLPFALFFRDPRRRIPSDEDAIVSPADGVVKDISIAPSPFDSNEKFKRIGIFLSVLDVHINRMPSNLMVKDIKYSEGKFHDARSPLAASENESNSLLCDAQFGDLKFPLIVKQISGAIARRIVSEAKIGAKFEKGAKFGMIKFGSRTELYLPEKTEFNISVKVGDKVFAGSTILAKIRR